MDAHLDVTARAWVTLWHPVPVELVRPSEEYLASYLSSLGHGWSSELAMVDADAAAAEHQGIAADPAAFLAELNDPIRGGRPITLPDGSQVPRLPGERRWMWDGDYCGAISLRWQPGTTDLPPYCLGHVGYAVVPWKRRRGYATQALAGMLDVARSAGLPFVDLVTDTQNLASQSVALANGAVLVREFVAPEAQGGFEARLFRIDLGVPG